MITVAVWLAFFSILPVVYWIFSMLFDRLRFLLMPKHKMEVEYVDENGLSTVQIVDASSDLEFYRIAMNAIRAGRIVRDVRND